MKSDRFAKIREKLIITGVLIALVGLFYLLNPNFLKSYNLLSMGQSVAPYLVMSLGVTFVIATGGIDLSIGTTCIAAATIAGDIYASGICPLWATIPIMIAIGTAVGLVNGILVAKFKLPAFIATLGSMMAVRGLSALIVVEPNIFYPSGTWYNNVFSSADGVPTGAVWCIVLTVVAALLMNKFKVGRYILSIGSNEEASRLSGIDTEKYKIIAYVISGFGAGLAAIFWASSFPTIATASGNGMELDAIAGVYIGGTSSAGGVASLVGSAIGSVMLVVIRSGLNFVLARFNLNLNATYATYVVTGLIVIISVLLDVTKNMRKKELRRKSKHQKAKLIAAIAIVLVLAIIIGLAVFFGQNEKEKTIAVIARGETHAFWLNVKRGAEDAAEKYGYTITFRGPASESPKDLPSQMEMVRTALSNNCAAVVLAANGDGFADMLMSAYDSGIPVVGFDSGIWDNDIKALEASGKDSVVSLVTLDSNLAGGLAAEKLFEKIKSDIANCETVFKIGIIQHDITLTAYGRADGFEDKFAELADGDSATRGKYEIIREEKPDESDNNYKTALESLYEKGVTAVYMTSEAVVRDVNDAIASSGEKYNNMIFCGFDAGTKQSEWMESDELPLLYGSVAQDSYLMGYKAVEQAIFAIEGKETTPNVSINGVWWNKENVDEMKESGIVYDG